MKSLWVFLIVMMALVTACIPMSANQSPDVLATPTVVSAPAPNATHIPVDISPAQRAALASVSKSLGVPAQELTLVSTESVTWPNGCMGIQRLGVMCTLNQVPGFRIFVQANGKQYEVHTNQDGSIVVPEQAMLAPGLAEKAAVSQLAKNLGIPESDIKVVSSTPIEWPNGCLGMAQPGVACSQIVTPGYLISLEAAGRQYDYHTSQDGSSVMPGSLALIWQQQGGIAGVCQNLDAYLSGEVYATNCGAGGKQKTGLLTASQRDQLNAWSDSYGTIMIDLSDPKGAADAMARTANLNGTGQQTVNKQTEQDIFKFGQALYQALMP